MNVSFSNPPKNLSAEVLMQEGFFADMPGFNMLSGILRSYGKIETVADFCEKSFCNEHVFYVKFL
jgi:hypothetical protein